MTVYTERIPFQCGGKKGLDFWVDFHVQMYMAVRGKLVTQCCIWETFHKNNSDCLLDAHARALEVNLKLWKLDFPVYADDAIVNCIVDSEQLAMDNL